MSSRDKKDARRVPAEFAFEEVGHGGRHGRRDREREREHEPPPQSHRQQLQAAPPPQAVASVTRPPGSGLRRREAFGGALTTEGSSTPQATSNNNTPGASRPSSPPHAGDADPAVLEWGVSLYRAELLLINFRRRHALFLTRLESVASHPATAVPAVRAATRGYRSSESSARDLILTIWNVLERNLDHTAGIVNAFVDLLDEEEKKQDLLSSWRGFAIEVDSHALNTVSTFKFPVHLSNVVNSPNSYLPQSAQDTRVLPQAACLMRNTLLQPVLLNVPHDRSGTVLLRLLVLPPLLLHH